MKTLLIDPFTQTITEHEFDGSLSSMYTLLQCSTVEGVYVDDEGSPLFDGENILFVDEGGLLCNLQEQAFFVINGKPIAGRAMTTNCDSHGETIESTVTLQDLISKVEWTTLERLRDSYA